MSVLPRVKCVATIGPQDVQYACEKNALGYLKNSQVLTITYIGILPHIEHVATVDSLYVQYIYEKITLAYFKIHRVLRTLLYVHFTSRVCDYSLTPECTV